MKRHVLAGNALGCLFWVSLNACASKSTPPSDDFEIEIDDTFIDLVDVADALDQAPDLSPAQDTGVFADNQNGIGEIEETFDFDSVNWAQPGCEPVGDAGAISLAESVTFASGPGCLPAISTPQETGCGPQPVCGTFPMFLAKAQRYPNSLHRFDDGSFFGSFFDKFEGNSQGTGGVWRMAANGTNLHVLVAAKGMLLEALDGSVGYLHADGPPEHPTAWRLKRWNHVGQLQSEIELDNKLGIEFDHMNLDQDFPYEGSVDSVLLLAAAMGTDGDLVVSVGWGANNVQSLFALDASGKIKWRTDHPITDAHQPVIVTSQGFLSLTSDLTVYTWLRGDALVWANSAGDETVGLTVDYQRDWLPIVFTSEGGMFWGLTDHMSACGIWDLFDSRVRGLKYESVGLVGNNSHFSFPVSLAFAYHDGVARVDARTPTYGGAEFSLQIETVARDGRRRTFDVENEADSLPCSIFEKYMAVAVPNGGFAIATPNTLYLANANGSATCPGCGPPAPDCSDKDPCTKDECDPKLGDCVHLPIVGCMKASGACFNAADCDDGEPCTTDSCDVVTGACGHAPQSTCDTGEDCFNFAKSEYVQLYVPEIVGTCINGTCTPNANLGAFPVGLKNEGYITRQLSQRPQVFEAKNTDTLVVGGWEAQRIQPNGVLRWQRDLDGAAAAAALTPDDGLVIAITQLHGKVQPGKTRIVRMAPTGQTLQDAIVTTGLDDWQLYQPWLERKRWLMPKPGGYILVGTKAWTADAWQGRIVQLTEGLTPTAAVDVTLPGFGAGEVPKDRAVEQFWPLPDGGVLVGWRLSDKSGLPRWGAARVAANGQVLWDKQLATGDEGAGGFDRWRPQGFVAQGGKTFVVRILPDGPSAPQLADVATYGKLGGFGQNPANLYAELPGQRTVTIIEVSDAFQLSATWPTLLPGYNNPGFVLHAFLDSQKQVISDVYVRSDKRVQLVISGGPQVTYNALITLDEHGLWPPCAQLEPPMDWTNPPWDDPLKCKGGYWPYYCKVPK